MCSTLRYHNRRIRLYRCAFGTFCMQVLWKVSELEHLKFEAPENFLLWEILSSNSKLT